MASEQEIKAMNDEQRKAIRSLERALKKCADAGISLMGMDSSLFAYDKTELDDAERELGCLYEAQCACGQGETVTDHGAYVDSGGW